jgi:hypothetical protein
MIKAPAPTLEWLVLTLYGRSVRGITNVVDTQHNFLVVWLAWLAHFREARVSPHWEVIYALESLVFSSV